MGREQIKWAQVIFLRISTNQAPPKNIWSVLVFRFKSMFCGQKKCIQVHDSKKQNLKFMEQTNIWSITKLRGLTWCRQIQDGWYISRGMEYFCDSRHRPFLFSRPWVNNKHCRSEVSDYNNTIKVRLGFLNRTQILSGIQFTTHLARTPTWGCRFFKKNGHARDMF